MPSRANTRVEGATRASNCTLDPLHAAGFMRAHSCGTGALIPCEIRSPYSNSSLCARDQLARLLLDRELPEDCLIRARIRKGEVYFSVED